MAVGARIRDVWAPNMEAEMRNIRILVEHYPYISMDTEFPGVVARPIGTFKTSSDYHYQTMRCNVDLLKIIQIGITLSNEKGEFPEDVSTWQFNFHFSLNEDLYSTEAIDVLEKSGIDFVKHDAFGIAPNDFAELLITSGLVLSEDTTWISFHSGYDFGYFIKVLSGDVLPTTEDGFFRVLKIWFPRSFDVKSICKAFNTQVKGALIAVAQDLKVARLSNTYLTGSDSLLTAQTFFKARQEYLDDAEVPEAEFNGKLFGLGPVFAQPNGSGVDQNLNHPSRGGTTIAEREDRQSSLASHGHGHAAHAAHAGHAHTLSGHSQASTMGTMGGLMSGMAHAQTQQQSVIGSGMPSQGQYAPMGANGAYIRSAIGGQR